MLPTVSSNVRTANVLSRIVASAFSWAGVYQDSPDGSPTAFNLSVIGGTVALAFGLHLLFVAVGRLLKRRFGTRLGAVYQFFSAGFSA